MPGIWHETYWFARHEACYRWVSELMATLPRPLTVLDAGSGEGFGAASLASPDVLVLAIDYDATTTAHHAATHSGVPVVRGNVVALPVATASVDVVVSLQTVEHVWDQSGYVAECARVLRDGGRAVLSTPNRRTFPPGNVFHHRELDAPEMQRLLRVSFPTVGLLGLAHGPELTAWEGRHGSIVDAQIAARPALWPTALAHRVATVTADDFVVTDDLDTCLDLVAVAAA